LLVARTGRHQERSTKLPAAKTASRPAGLVPTLFDFGPVRNLFFPKNAEADGLLAIERLLTI
jgi:hypothetical protein